MNSTKSAAASQMKNIKVTSLSTWHYNKVVINPRRACAARVIVVVLCVCLSVCLSTTILGLQATKWLMSDTNIFSATRARNLM